MHNLNKLLIRILSRLGFHRAALILSAKNFWRRGEPEIQLLPWLVDPHKVSLDVGANNGMYSWHLLRLSSAVVAFEPNPVVYSILRQALPGLDARQMAVGAKSSSTMLRVPLVNNVTLSGWGTIHPGNDFTEISPDSTKTYTVNVASLDSFELSNVGFIKIDVEGHENEVLEGARHLLCSQRPNLLIEIGGDVRGNSTDATCTLLHELGYMTMYLSDGKLLQGIDRVPEGCGSMNIIAIPQAAQNGSFGVVK